MSIAICKMNIIEDIFFKADFSDNEKSALKSLNNYNFSFEVFEWEKISIADFIDFLEFSDYHKLYVITNKNSQRLLNIMKYAEDISETEIKVYNSNELNTSDFNNIDFQFSYGIEVSNLYHNSYMALNTGFYPKLESLTIKHIVTNNINLINSLDSSIEDNKGFNSLILTKESPIISSAVNNFSKIMTLNDFCSKNNQMKFQKLTPNSFLSLIENFFETGNINYCGKIYANIGRYLQNKQLTGFFLYEDGIYYDNDKYIELSRDLNTNVYQLINTLNQQVYTKNISDETIRMFFFMHTIVESYEEDLQFVSSYNTYKLPPSDISQRDNMFNHWLGFRTKEDFYMYNASDNRTFKVNEEFLVIFEQIIKNQKYNNIDSAQIREIKEVLSNA